MYISICVLQAIGIVPAIGCLLNNFCFILKLFRANYVGCNPLSIVKLNGKKIRWIIAQKLKGESTSTIAEIQGISPRRVQQIYKEYVKTGKPPEIGHNIGRPKKTLSSDDKKLIDQSYYDYKFGACYLEIIIRSKYHHKISHNRIHKYLLRACLKIQPDLTIGIGLHI
jgi:transposase